MVKSLAALFLLTAVLVAMRGKNVSDWEEANTKNTQPSANIIKDVRPVHRHSCQAKARRLRASQLSQKSHQALLDAAGLELTTADRVQWDDKKFESYLNTLSEHDARALIQYLVSNTATGTRLLSPSGRCLMPASSHNHNASNTKSVVLAGLLEKLASRDFVNTLDFIAQLPKFEQNKLTSQFFYETVLRAGASQAPERAWETYLAKCSSPFG